MWVASAILAGVLPATGVQTALGQTPVDSGAPRPAPADSGRADSSRARRPTRIPGTARLGPVVVTGQRTVAGGQVAAQADVGVLGAGDVYSTPFATTAYTDRLIRDQQARALGDVFSNDASVRLGTSRYAESEAFLIRGFQVNTGSTLFNGLPGLIDERQPSLDGIARAELLRGPSGVVNNGAADASVGGTVNFVAKRAEAAPLTRLTVGYAGDAEGEGHLDVGRRFGAGDAFGVRANLGGRRGDTPLDQQRETFGIGTLGADYRGARLTASVDLAHEDRTLLANLSPFNVGGPFAIPRAPDAADNLFDRSSYYRRRNTIGVGQVDYRVTQAVTVFGAYGHRRAFERYRGAFFPTIADADGTVAVSVIPYRRDDVTDVARVGARARFGTGPLTHQLTVAADGYWDHNPGGYAFKDELATNLYRPVALAPLTPAYPDPDNLYVREDDRTSVVLADVVSALGGRVSVIGGARAQRIQSSSREPGTGALQGAAYDRRKLTPSVALLVKPAPRLTLYANYVEALQTGPTAPAGTANADEVFAPVVAKQREVGAKVDLGAAGLTLAAYQITQPSGVTTVEGEVSRFGVDGEQRNRGLELNVFGTVAPGLRLLGGLSDIDARQVRTDDRDGDGRGDADGRRAVGVPRVQVNVGGEWDVPAVAGVTLSTRALYTARAAVDAANTQAIPAWTRVDMGARYGFTLTGRALVARLNVENVADRNYWASALGGALSIGAPRTVLASLSVDF